MSTNAASTVRDEYLGALIAADGTRARHVVTRAVAGGMPVADVYLDVLEPAMQEIGALWEAAQLSTAYEHYATSITQGVIGALGPRMRVAPMSGRLAILSCTPDERHGIGLQMIGDFLEGVGWEVLNLGPSLPVGDLVALAEDEQPDAVALSTSTPDRLPGAHAALAELRALPRPPFLVVGGRAWHAAGSERVLRAGADACVRGPVELTRLLTERFPPTTDDDDG